MINCKEYTGGRADEVDFLDGSWPPPAPWWWRWSEDFFFSCNDAFVNDRLLLEEPPWLAIVTFQSHKLYATKLHRNPITGFNTITISKSNHNFISKLPIPIGDLTGRNEDLVRAAQSFRPCTKLWRNDWIRLGRCEGLDCRVRWFRIWKRKDSRSAAHLDSPTGERQRGRTGEKGDLEKRALWFSRNGTMRKWTNQSPARQRFPNWKYLHIFTGRFYEVYEFFFILLFSGDQLWSYGFDLMVKGPSECFPVISKMKSNI